MSDEHEVIVVGSGPAGVSPAWALLESGVRVLMLDASASVLCPPSDGRWIGDTRRLKGLACDDTAGTSGASPKLSTPLARSVLVGFAESLALSGHGFMPFGSLAVGGLSNIWGALAHPYEGADLAGFPDRTGFESALARVGARIGLSTPNESGDDETTHLTAPIRRLLARHRTLGGDASIDLSLASNAVLTEPKGSRDACNGCGLCLYGCARGAIYNSALELPALRRHPLFSYRSGHRVVALRPALDGHDVEAMQGDRLEVLQARRVVLAAGTIATTALAVRRLGLQGRRIRLLTNPVGGTALLIPALVGRALPERSFALGQLCYRVTLEADADMFGVLYGADALPLAPVADRLPFTRATSLRLARALAPALVLATGYLPGQLSDNEMIVSGSATDGGIVINGVRHARSDDLLRLGFSKLARFMRRRGAWMVPGATALLPSGADAHPAGTLPLGGSGDLSTSDYGELRGARGLYVADGASLPRLASIHPTLTIMANADRIGRHIAVVQHEEKANEPAL